MDPANAIQKVYRKWRSLSESSRKSNRSSKRLDVTMISGPQDDLRHTGHIGYDGAMFGDVSFIGNNYNKLPVKVGPNGE